MQRFENKTVIVTGGGGGIGGATCRRFGREGARVAVSDLNLEAARKVAADIQQTGGKAEAFECDITRRSSVDAAVARGVGTRDGRRRRSETPAAVAPTSYERRAGRGTSPARKIIASVVPAPRRTLDPRGPAPRRA